MTHQNQRIQKTQKNRASIGRFALSFGLMLQTLVAIEHYHNDEFSEEILSLTNDLSLTTQVTKSSAKISKCLLDDKSSELSLPVREEKIPFYLTEDILFKIEDTCHLFLTPEAGEALNNFFTNFAYEKSLELYLLHGIHFLKPLTIKIHNQMETFCNKIENSINQLLDFKFTQRKKRKNDSNDKSNPENSQINQIQNSILQNFVSSCSQHVLDFSIRNVNHYLDRLSGEVIGPQLIAPLVAKAINEIKVGTLLQNQFFKNLCEYNSSFKPFLVEKNIAKCNDLLNKRDEAIEKLESLKQEPLPASKTREEQELENEMNAEIKRLDVQLSEKLGMLDYAKWKIYLYEHSDDEFKTKKAELNTLKIQVSTRENERNQKLFKIRRTGLIIEKHKEKADETQILINKIKNYQPCPLDKEHVHKEIKHWLSFLMKDSHKRRLTLCKNIIQDLHKKFSRLTTMPDEDKKRILDILVKANEYLNEEDENLIDSDNYYKLAEHTALLSANILMSGRTSHIKKMETSDSLELFMEELNLNLQIAIFCLNQVKDFSKELEVFLDLSLEYKKTLLKQINIANNKPYSIDFDTLALYRSQEIVGQYMQPCPHIIPGKTLRFLIERVYPTLNGYTYDYLNHFVVFDNLRELTASLSPTAFQGTYNDTLDVWNKNDDEENYSHINLMEPTLGHLFQIKRNSDNLAVSLHKATLPLKAAASIVPSTLMIGSLYFITGDFTTAMLCLPDFYTNGFYSWLAGKTGV